MDYSVVVNALYLVVGLSVPILAAVLAGALLAGVLQTVTQIEDPAFGFFSRLAGAVLALMITGSYVANQLTSFTVRIWGGMDFYR